MALPSVLTRLDFYPSIFRAWIFLCGELNGDTTQFSAWLLASRGCPLWISPLLL